MAASYPAAVKNFSAVVNGVTKLVAALFNSPYEEITAVETELGTDVAGTAADLKTRLAVSINDNGTLKAVAVSIGTYTGNATPGLTEAHGLGRVPVFVHIMDPTGGELGTWVTGLTTIHSAYAGPKNDFSVDATNFTIDADASFNYNARVYTYICM